MGKSLVIVESPAKARTINKYLGHNYVVKSSIGHIRDLPTSNSSTSRKNYDKEKIICKKIKKDARAALVSRMGIDPWKDWQVEYQILPGKENIVLELRHLADEADHIYLATDLDREGEAIAWHLQQIIGEDNKRFSRVIFNEITEKAINKAFENPGEINIKRVYAQQARRFMDRVVGYMVSPLLWKKIARGLSAGRVQSVAVRLIVEREQEIKSFLPKEYWKVDGIFNTLTGDQLNMQVTHQADKIFRPIDKNQTKEAISILQKAYYKISYREDKQTNSKPSAPFITSTLQQAASTHLGFSVKKTMIIAQLLYEAGYITYMRTDSTSLSKDAITTARSYIEEHFGKKYLPELPNLYYNKSNSQEAHEAIRPSNIYMLAEELKCMEANAKKLYQLIWRQFIACQMVPAQYDLSMLKVKADDFELKAKGRTLCFDGWIKIMPSISKNNKSNSLPKVNVGDYLTLKELIVTQHFTKPPIRFSEALLVRELEKRGIGRPSTYANIISTIQDRGYIRITNHRFYAEKMGEIVTHRLKENFQELMNYDFTAHMEDNLDQIANNKVDWKIVLNSFFKNFSRQLNKAEKEPKEGGMQPNKMVLISINCPICNRKMGIRTASTGVFLGCSGYTLSSKERCKKTINLITETEIINVLEGDDAEAHALLSRRRCQNCSTAMDSYLIDNQCKLHICGNNPECDGYEIEKGNFHIDRYNGLLVYCEKCNYKMDLKIGRFGKYMSCTNQDCKNTRKLLRNGELAPPKQEPISLPELLCKKSDAYFVLRDGASGIFFAANTFPKSRETRTPLVEELQRFVDRLPEQLKYLAKAPAIDPEGNKTIIRFSHKTKQQYISSEKQGKITNWAMFYIDGKWQKIKE
ncbi:type I DNA topoisomerase [Pantoea sp. Aalb]|uniref:type I DNA topoisomerase n=1 Tax=Pantoea sp. Aalb TaxID=2576762 RepID=UPI0013235F1D|nr:type I DNA topoisomerase [Pantoea sp. Aalb]MXP67397.1 type I DNA topoisomerase [Pantoea sp. Aalb]